jgi:DNA repair exonuclease SbcCD ATPase subunit
MIVLKTLQFSNIFSYGENNVVHFDQDPITQIVGKNGHGKSSIPLILEEVLFNKNSKGIKKADIINRNVKAKQYSIELDFEKDGDVYNIKTTRGSTQTVQVLKNGASISAHTATATFKLIEDILGLDHKAFSQLVYQSSASSLEFLTATDTNRKKFLIDLLNLNKYIEASEVFKEIAKSIQKDADKSATKISTTQVWLDKNAKEDLSILAELVVETPDRTLSDRVVELTAAQKTADATNKKISTNRTYKEQLAAIPVESTLGSTELASDSEYAQAIGKYRTTQLNAEAFITKMSKLQGTCPTCLHDIDKDKVNELVNEQLQIVVASKTSLSNAEKEVIRISKENALAKRVAKAKSDWESYHSLINNELQDSPIDIEDLQKEITQLETTITAQQVRINTTIKHNNTVSAHNSRVQVINSQMCSMLEEISSEKLILESLTKRLSTLQILQKTFSTNGLIAYKIECLVKDLESLANEYLNELSSGRFQLTFKVSAADKLNVVITDNGKDIEILALSGGERARVNTATLLAIRKLMQSLSNARINLLVLDETIEVLDVEGKERLVEVLLKEEYLNTFLISHGFTHPLLEKISVVKENNISRLE